MEINEFNIEVPWGHIACKTYGNPNNPVVLLLHGNMDNLGSFEFLIPQLPKEFHYITIDWPGHGYSSKFGGHLINFILNNVMALKYVTDHFNYKNYKLIAHSNGGEIAIIYTFIYPSIVEKLVLIDSPSYRPLKPKDFIENIRDNIDYCMHVYRTETDYNQRKYDYEKAINMLQNNRHMDRITKKVAEKLAERSLVGIDDGSYRFGSDRICRKIFGIPNDWRYIQDVLKTNRLECPTIMIITKSIRKIIKNDKNWKWLIDDYSKRENVRIIYVNYGHDCHMYEPGEVAPIISQFLRKKSKL